MAEASNEQKAIFWDSLKLLMSKEEGLGDNGDYQEVRNLLNTIEAVSQIIPQNSGTIGGIPAWQQYALNGELINAIKSLREDTPGYYGLKEAKDFVEGFMARKRVGV